jgi:hypothetical protein
MARRTGSRKERFAAALARAGQTHARFAALHQVTYQHLYLVIRGKRRSPRLEAAIDAFIAAHQSAHAA